MINGTGYLEKNQTEYEARLSYLQAKAQDRCWKDPSISPRGSVLTGSRRKVNVCQGPWARSEPDRVPPLRSSQPEGGRSKATGDLTALMTP